MESNETGNESSVPDVDERERRAAQRRRAHLGAAEEQQRREALDRVWQEALRVTLSLALLIAALFPVLGSDPDDDYSFSWWGMFGLMKQAPDSFGPGDVVFMIAIIWTVLSLIATLIALLTRPSSLGRRTCILLASALGLLAVGHLILLAIINGFGPDDSDILTNWVLCSVLAAALSVVYGIRAADARQS